MPVLLSSDGFALLFDDFAASTMVASDSIVYTTESDLPVTYYYIGGVHSLAELTTALTSLTGRQPLPPFWAMGYITSKYGYKSPEETVAAVDCLVPGVGEILGGSAREDDFEILEKRIVDLGMNPDDYKAYLDLRKYGSCEHAGFGVGFERLVMYLTGIDNIRDVLPHPRTVGNAKF